MIGGKKKGYKIKATGKSKKLEVGHETSTSSNFGRPPLYATPEEMQKNIDKYGSSPRV